jgi:hypothetical protein
MSGQCGATHTDQLLLNPPAEIFTETTVLSRAIKIGTIKEVSVLLKNGCDPNLPCGPWGMRPLMVAEYISSKVRKRQIIQLLLQYGAVPSLTDNSSRNCLMYACAVKSSDSINAMLQASEYDFYASDCDGNTLLHLCAMVGDSNVLNSVLKYASQYRCDLNRRNKWSFTALLTAILRRRKECAMILHEYGASPRFAAADFQSILHAIDLRCHLQVYKNVHDHLLLRVISDSCCILYHTKGQVHDIKCSKAKFPIKCLEPTASSVNEAEEQCQHNSQGGSAGAARCVKMSNKQHNSCFKLMSLDTCGCLLKCANSTQSPSYMESIDDLLSHLYHVRRSASYRNPPVHNYDVNEEWVDTIRKYQLGEQCCDSVQVENNVKPPLRLARTISSPSNNGLQSVNPAEQATSRPKSLSRSTTSPHFFSQTSLARKCNSNTRSIEAAVDELNP